MNDSNNNQRYKADLAKKQTPVEGFQFNSDQWDTVRRSSHLHSFQNKNGLDQLHIGRKPFFESIVPTAFELHRTLFQQISSESALDWRTLGIQPGDQRLHKATIVEIWSGQKVALDLIPIFVNSQRQHYAVATFVYRNYPIYFASKQIKDLNQFKKYLLSTFTLE